MTWLRKGNGHSLSIDERSSGPEWMVFLSVPAGHLSFTVRREDVQRFVDELTELLADSGKP